MALCPLAIASTADQTKGTGTYYFALNGGSAPVRDQAFIAEGFGSPPNQGYFKATSQDTVGNGTDAFIMTDISGVIRWGIGTSGVEAGANSGDNFAIYNYDDNGAFLSAPIQINRASGGVLMDNGLTVGNSLIATGSLVGPDGPVLAQQLDFLSAQQVNLPAAPAAGQTIVPIGATFSVPRTGIYMLSGILGYNGSPGTTLVAGASDFFSVILTPSPPSPGALVGGVTVNITPCDATDRAWENVATVKLTGGVPYQANFFIENISGTLAATGGAALVGSYDLVALC